MSKTVMILGGDGYIGWSYGLHRAITTNDKIILVDSYLKRSLQKKVGVENLYTVPYQSERVKTFKKFFGKNNLESACLDVTNYKLISSFIEKYQPDVILNAAQQPSAPLSMISPEMASLTLTNNQQSILNVLWAVKTFSPKTVVINMGSAGAYLSIDAELIPDKPVNLSFKHDGSYYDVKNTWLPMQASDFYHQSKAHTFAIADICVKLWDLKTVTVQQSTVFGQCAYSSLPNDLYSIMNYDHLFGTVLNRFICQAVKGVPLTVYGDGLNYTNIISLCDTISIFDIIMDCPLSEGEHKVINSFTDMMTIEQIALKVIDIYGKGSIEYIENPRKEESLKYHKKFERFIATENNALDNSIKQTIDFVEKFSYNIKPELFYPTVKWD